MVDFTGTQIKIGDRFIGLRHQRTSSYFFKGTVVGFTPKSIRYTQEGSDTARVISGYKIVVKNDMI